MPLFKRAYRLKIQVGDTLKTYDELKENSSGLKIDFEVECSANANFSKGNITISGLKQSDIALIATNRTPQGDFKPSKVELEVGYIDSLSLILSGNITQAETNFTSPDQTLRVAVMSAFETSQTQVSDSAQNITFRDLCQIVASNNKLTLRYDSSVPNKAIGDYSFQGTPYEQIQRLREYMPDKAIIAVRNTILDVSAIGGKGEKKITLDSSSGLLGDPSVTSHGCEVKMLLNPALNVNDWVELKSERIPQLNSQYRILELRHRGGNYGDIWESHLSLTRW